MQTKLLTSTPTLILALGLAALTTPALAQSEAGSGLLGKRYAEASAFAIDYNHFEDNGYGVGATVNVPVSTHLDVGAFFNHTGIEGHSSDPSNDDFQDLAAYAALYTAHGDFRPFAKATLAYEWWSVSDDAWYQIDVGSEYLVTDRLSVSAEVSWDEFLAEDWNGGSFSTSARANFWVTDSIATSASVTYIEGGHWGYGVAAVFQF